MPESTEYAIAVRQYGLLRPRDWGEDCEAELLRMTALWNKLVAIEQEHRVAYLQVTAGVPQVAEARTKVKALMERRCALIQARKTANKVAGKRVKSPESVAAIAALGRQLHSAIEVANDAQRMARVELRPALALIEEKRKAAVKLARQESGLYWGNYNAVCQSYESARTAAIKNKAMLHERHGAGRRITNQIQGGMTAEDLMTGAHSQVRIDPCPPGEHGYLMLTATIYTRGGDDGRIRRTVTWPIKLHRPLPDGSRIQEVVVTREARAGRWRWNAVFTCRVPKTMPREETHACGIDIGWRKRDDGSLRIAVVADAGGHDEIVLPAPMIERLFGFYDRISARHQARHEMILRLENVNWDRAPVVLAMRAKDLLKQRDDKGRCRASGADLRGLAAEWAGTSFLPDLRQEIMDWARDDRQNWFALQGHGGHWHARGNGDNRRRALLARRELYRIAAKRIVDRYGLIGIEKIDWGQLSIQAVEVLPQLVRRLRAIAAPAEFLTALKSAARREGVRIHEHVGPSSFLCHACGHETAVNDRSALHYTCGHCLRVHDQDVNAARNLYAAARASAPVTSETPLPLAWQKRLAGKMKSRPAVAASGSVASPAEERSQS